MQYLIFNKGVECKGVSYCAVLFVYSSTRIEYLYECHRKKKSSLKRCVCVCNNRS